MRDVSVSNIMEEESIDLDSFEIPSNAVQELKLPDIQDRVPVASLSQKGWLGSKLDLQLFENGVIRLERSGKPPQLLRSGILRMPPRQYYRLSNFAILMGMVLAGILMFLFFAQYIDYRVFAGLLLIALVGMLAQIKLHIRFSTVGAGCLLFKLNAGFLKRAPILTFADEIKNYQRQCELFKAPLPLLIQEHRRLCDGGVITKQAYEIAKNRLFSMRKNANK